MNRKVYALGLTALSALWAQAGLAVEANQIDDFDSGSTQGWQVGNTNNHPAPPEQRADCGDQGAGDGCLVLTSTGQAGPGGRMTVFNTGQWTGDYLATNISGLALRAANMGKEDVYLRVRVESTVGGPLISSDFFQVPADGIYHDGFIRLTENAFNSFDTAAIQQTITTVSNFRIFHNVDPSFQGPIEAHEVYVDDLTAVPIDTIMTSPFDLPPRPNDTGVTLCANATQNDLACPAIGFPGQDAENGRDATDPDDADGKAGFSFTKLNGAGNPLPATATSWACVRDNVTGLMWEVKTQDGSFRDAAETFNWYNPDPNTNGGDPGDEGFACDPQSEICNINQFVDEMNSIGLCGFSDWRAPSAAELVGLIDYGAPQNPAQAAIDLDYFPFTPRASYWSGTTSASDGSGAGAFLIDFRNGRMSNASKQIAGASFRVTRGKSQ